MSIPTLSQNRYKITAPLGKGGMACVFKVYDSRLKVEKAIKIPNYRCLMHEHIRRRFEVEASTMAQLHHQNIVIVHDIIEEHYHHPESHLDIDLVYMVMEMMPGGSLRDRIEKFGPLHPQQAIDATIAMASGLGFAHSKGIVHRDIKIDNVLIATDNTLKVTDFGIAQIDGGPSETQTGITMGTLPYMAPEQRLSARQANAISDLYSVAASFFVLLTGNNPSELYLNDVQEIAFENFTPPVRAFFTKGCHFAPEQRFQSAEEMIHHLQQLRVHFEKLPPNALPFFMEGMSPNLASTPSEIEYLWNALLGIHPISSTNAAPISNVDSDNDTHETALELDLIGDLSDSSDVSIITAQTQKTKAVTKKVDTKHTPQQLSPNPLTKNRLWFVTIFIVFFWGWWFTKDVDSHNETMIEIHSSENSTNTIDTSLKNSNSNTEIPKSLNPNKDTPSTNLLPTGISTSDTGNQVFTNEEVSNSDGSKAQKTLLPKDDTSNPSQVSPKTADSTTHSIQSHDETLNQKIEGAPSSSYTKQEDLEDHEPSTPIKTLVYGTRTISSRPYTSLTIDGIANEKLCEGKSTNTTFCTLKLPVGIYTVHLTTQDGRRKDLPIPIAEGDNPTYCYQFDINSQCVD